MNTFLAQLTDTHIREPGQLAYGRLDTAPYLSAALDTLMRMPQNPHAVILTGDLTDFGHPGEYAHLAELLACLKLPFYLMPGNHDDRENLRAAFPTHGYLGSRGFIQYSIKVRDVRLIAIDTTEPGQSSGRLCSWRLDWLRAELAAEPAVPTVIAMHHPPFKTLIEPMDEIGLLEGGDELESIIAAHPSVKRVICGHLHRTIYTGFAGTVASTAPSPAHQVTLDFGSSTDSAWNLEPPGFHLHVWNSTGVMLTHAVPVGQFEGPFSF